MQSIPTINKEQKAYLIEHYPYDNIHDIASAMTSIGAKCAEAKVLDLLNKAESLEGTARIRCLQQSYEAAKVVPVTVGTVQYFASRYKLKKKPTIKYRTCRSTKSDFVSDYDDCVFFSGSYAQEINDVMESNKRRFIYYHADEPINMNSLKTAVKRMNSSEGRKQGKALRVKSYKERNLVVISIEDVRTGSDEVSSAAHTHPPSSPAPLSSPPSGSVTAPEI